LARLAPLLPPRFAVTKVIDDVFKKTKGDADWAKSKDEIMWIVTDMLLQRHLEFTLRTNAYTVNAYLVVGPKMISSSYHYYFLLVRQRFFSINRPLLI
jgi:hypothetical protein